MTVFESDTLYLTDGGLETTLSFHYKLQLDLFAAFMALSTEAGKTALTQYYLSFIEIAKRHPGCGMILETATWRASPDWFHRLGISLEEGKKLIHESCALLKNLRKDHIDSIPNFLIAGVLGPRGDGYKIDSLEMTINLDEMYQKYHSVQIGELCRSGVSFLSAVTMTNIPEALAIVRVCKAISMPCVVSFTLETNGTLPSGDSLVDALKTIDEATQCYPLHYMINCAHPTHFSHLWAKNDADNFILKRIRGLRCNASSKSHQELDDSTELDEGNPQELARLVSQFTIPGMPLDPSSYRIAGGCCGTDSRHIAAMGEILFNQ